MPSRSHGLPAADSFDSRAGVVVMDESSAMDDEGSDETSRSLIVDVRERVSEHFVKLEPELRLMIDRRISPKLQSRIDVESVLQGAIMRLMRSLASRSPRSNELLRAWIIRSVLNEWYDQLRQLRSQKQDVDRDEPLPDGSIDLMLSGMGVSTCFRLKETIDRIRNVVAPEVFEIVWMRAVDRYSFGEIAEITGMKENTVNRCYVRALEKIQKSVSSPFGSSG